MKKILFILATLLMFGSGAFATPANDVFQVDMFKITIDGTPTTDNFDTPEDFDTNWEVWLGNTNQSDVSGNLLNLYRTDAEVEGLQDDAPSIGLTWLQNSITDGDVATIELVFKKPAYEIGGNDGLDLYISGYNGDDEEYIDIGLFGADMAGGLSFGFEWWYVEGETEEEVFDYAIIEWDSIGTYFGMKVDIGADGTVTGYYALNYTGDPGDYTAFDTQLTLYSLAGANYNVNIQTWYNPEPQTIILILLGLFGLAWRFKKKK